MIVVGIVGGIASGKSVVTREFERLGAASINADKIGHDVLELPDIIEELAGRWGPAVMANGSLDRAAIAKIVFADTEQGRTELAFLESISHPRISLEVTNRIKAFRDQNIPMVIVDAALLLKAGWDAMCDTIIYVEVDRKTRLARAQSERGWTEEQYDQREQSQIPLSLKRSKANILIDNSGELGQTRIQVREVWDRLIDNKPTK